MGFATTTGLLYFYLFYLDKCASDDVLSQLTDLAFLITSGLNINSNLRVIVKFLSQLSECFPFPLQVCNYIWKVRDKEQAGFFLDSRVFKILTYIVKQGQLSKFISKVIHFTETTSSVP